MIIENQARTNIQINHYQKKYQAFEKLLSDKYKETDQGKKMLEHLNLILTPEQKKTFDYDTFTKKFAYTDSQAFVSQFSGPISQANYSYQKDDRDRNDLTLIAGMSLRSKDNVTYKIENNHIETVFGSNTLTDDQIRESLTLASSLNKFIRYANGQSGSPYLDKTRESSLLSLFNRNGLNTSKAFVVNGVAFNTQTHNRLEKAGIESSGFTALPDYLIKKQFDAYAEELGLILDWEDGAYL